MSQSFISWADAIVKLSKMRDFLQIWKQLLGKRLLEKNFFFNSASTINQTNKC